MNRPLVLILSLLLISILPMIQSPVHATGTTVYIAITDPNPYGFSPQKENITTGTTVVWNNTGTQEHTVFSDGTPSFQSSPYNLERYGQTGQHTYSVFLGQPGVYAYHCSIHPFMKGTLNVTGSPVSPPSGSGGLSDYVIPLAVVAAALIVGGVAVFAWRRRSTKTRSNVNKT